MDRFQNVGKGVAHVRKSVVNQVSVGRVLSRQKEGAKCQEYMYYSTSNHSCRSILCWSLCFRVEFFFLQTKFSLEMVPNGGRNNWFKFGILGLENPAITWVE